MSSSPDAALPALPAPPAPRPITAFPPTFDGILKWSLQFHDNVDYATAPTIDPERRAFLQNALAAMSVDLVKIIGGMLAKLTDPATADEACAEALDELLDYVEDIDIARDFLLVGGGRVLLSQLAKSDDVTSRSLDALSAIVQNNPKCQEMIQPLSPMTAVAEVLRGQHSSQVAAKAIRFVSCMVRGSDALLSDASKSNIFALVISLLARDHDEAVFNKSFFLLRHLTDSPQIIQAAAADGVLEIAASRISNSPIHDGSEWSQACESAASFLGALAQDDRYVSLIQGSAAGIQAVAQARLGAIARLSSTEAREAYTEEVAALNAVVRAFGM